MYKIDEFSKDITALVNALEIPDSQQDVKLPSIKNVDESIKKYKIELSKLEQIDKKKYLQDKFFIKLDDDIKTWSARLDDFTDNLLNPISKEISESMVKDLTFSLDKINYIVDILVYDNNKLKKRSNKWYVFKRQSKINKNLDIIKDFLSIRKSLKIKIQATAKELSTFIVDHIDTVLIVLYIFYSLSKEQKQNFFAIELLNSIDRMIDVIELSFGQRRLKSQDMAYYYVIYELRELRTQIYTSKI